ncbi:hypothetical protein PACTADRAFT_1819 [Pachysolen tannophilus NRRL Y-2460]|uniref:Alpha-1,3-glucosyltransferase n=1 Tax=Pachysolen tannophilus NRRL Y-2460 TaxID=669874 RepID=A0A1E4TZT6_PACTA|nr:hypothetical protein PACTADRAFT_1819 [Pachysolen tannophilus NRRL Y-2460]
MVKGAKLQKSSFYSSPLHDFLTPFKPAQNQWVARYIIIIFAAIIRYAVGLGSFSGFKTPPMYGDFEAQRHWLEITINLPLKDWYFYDLNYWGLDYPPLTAYHSWIFGKIGSFFCNEEWFKLGVSRGYEDLTLKSYMRFTSLVSELFFLFPWVILITRWFGRNNGQSPIDQTCIAAAILFQPCLIIIDHGHFQYNSVMLGLALASFVNLLYDNYELSSIFFVLSICFKQMSLYYAPFIFSYLLSLCVIDLKHFKINLPRLVSIGSSVTWTLFMVFLPFLIYGNGLKTDIGQILYRVFPFDRGIFEDKVANFWCTTNIFIKYREIFSVDQLKKLSILLTLIGFLPCCILIFIQKKIDNSKKILLLYGFAITSWSFYFFSFQVHEKSVLVPLLPTILLLVDNDPNVISMICWISNICYFSLWPLLKKDGLVLQYYVLFILSNWLIGNLNWISKLLPNSVIPGPTLTIKLKSKSIIMALPNNFLWRVIIIGSYIACGVIHFLEIFYNPPKRYPDLFVIGNITLSFCCFVIFWVWLHYKMIQLSKA